MLINCPECNREISDNARTCPHCGYSIRKTNKTAAIVIVTIIAVIVLIVGGVIVIHLVKSRTKGSDNLSGKGQTVLSEKERAVYDMMLEVCGKAKDPSSVTLVDSAIYFSDKANNYIGFLKVETGGQVYYVSVDYTNGEYELSELNHGLESEVDKQFHDYDDNVDKGKVQKEIDRTIDEKSGTPYSDDKSTLPPEETVFYESGRDVLKISADKLQNNSVFTVCSGSIENTGQLKYKLIQVKAEFLDSYGRVIDTGWTYGTDIEGLEPGESSTFEISVLKNEDIASVDVTIVDYESNY